MQTQLRLVEFANPWHDSIGRFAPKGTGSSSGGGGASVGGKVAGTVAGRPGWADSFDPHTGDGWADYQSPGGTQGRIEVSNGKITAKVFTRSGAVNRHGDRMSIANKFFGPGEEGHAVGWVEGSTEHMDLLPGSGSHRVATQFRLVDFANPWHDDIGRFAPKGSGSTVGGGPRADAASVLSNRPGWEATGIDQKGAGYTFDSYGYMSPGKTPGGIEASDENGIVGLIYSPVSGRVGSSQSFGDPESAAKWVEATTASRDG